MNVCTECGAELSATAKFCTNCGQARNKEEATIQTASYNEASVSNSEAIAQEAATETGTETETETVQVGVEDGLTLLADYAHFFKETLIKPTAIFTEATGNWLNGLLSLLLFSGVFSLNVTAEFLPTIFRVILMQALLVGALFLVSKLFSDHSATYLDALETYGGLIQGQIVLFFLLWVVGRSSEGLASFLLAVAFLNQINLLNLYLLNIQSESRLKLDNYYQLILANIVFVLLIVFMFNTLFN